MDEASDDTNMRLRQLKEKEKMLAKELETILNDRKDKKDKMDEQSRVLRQMGCLYIERGITSGDLEDCTKASALLNGALVRTESPEDRESILHDIHRSWVQLCFLTEGAKCPAFKEWLKQGLQNRKRLLGIRKNTEDRCQSLKALWDRYDTAKLEEGGEEEDDRDTAIGNEAENVRQQIIKETRSLAEHVSGEMKGLYRLLLQKCETLLGKAPSTYAVIGMGSISRDEVTPFSDLEFAILIPEMLQRNEDELKYWKYLTYIFHLHILDFGETLLPSMAIDSLNDFYGLHDGRNWFYDDAPSGLKFDGAMPWACKTPLGRPEKGNCTKPALTLIGPPSTLASYLIAESSLKQGYHVAEVLSCVSCIYGCEKLFADFEKKSFKIRACDSELNRWLTKFKEQVNIASTSGFLSNSDGDVKKVKHDIYRLPSVLISIMRLANGVKVKSPWAVVEKLQQVGIFTEEAGQSLLLLISVAYGLRLCTYNALKSQRERLSFMSPYRSIEPDESQEYHITNNVIIIDTFCTLAQLVDYFTICCSKSPEFSFKQITCDLSTMDDRLFYNILEQLGLQNESLLLQLDYLEEMQGSGDSDNPETRIADSEDLMRVGLTATRVGDDKLALAKFQEAARIRLGLCLDENDVIISRHVCNILLRLGRPNEAELCARQELAQVEALNTANIASEDTLTALLDVGRCLTVQKKDDEAAVFLEQCSKMTIDNAELKHMKDMILMEMVQIDSRKGRHKVAMKRINEVIRVRSELYGNTNHHSIAVAMRVKAEVLSKCGDHLAACETIDHAKNLFTKYYQTEYNRPVLLCLVDQHRLLNNVGRCEESYAALEQAYAISKKLCEEDDMDVLILNTLMAKMNMGRDEQLAMHHIGNVLSVSGDKLSNARVLECHLDALSCRGTIHFRSSKFDDAFHDFRDIAREAVGLPEYSGNRYYKEVTSEMFMLKCCILTGKYTEAISIGEKLLLRRGDPLFQDTQHTLGNAYLKLAKQLEERKLFETALQTLNKLRGEVSKAAEAEYWAVIEEVRVAIDTSLHVSSSSPWSALGVYMRNVIMKL